jgi:hypothetical protein
VVRLPVITSSTAQNFETNIGADAEVTHDGIPIAGDMALICSTA